MKKLMPLVLSVGIVVLLSGTVVAARASMHELPQINAPNLGNAELSEIVGSENIMHAGMAEVLSEGHGGSGGAAPYVFYEAGKATYKVLTSKPALYVYVTEAYNAVRNWITGGGSRNNCSNP